MKTIQKLIATAGIACMTAAAANAGTAMVDGLGGAVTMRSGTVAGVFGAASPNFTNAALSAIHADLASDGVITDGKVTSILLDTDNGLTWAVLVDEENGVFRGFNSSLDMSTTGNTTHSEFINDNGSDLTVLPPVGPFQTVQGTFDWDAQDKGDGFAWANLQVEDTFSFDFFDTGSTLRPDGGGLDAMDTFQFVSWNGNAWTVVDTGEFSPNDQFSYSVRVIPLPQPALLGLAGFAGLGAIRRRKIS